MSSRKIVDFALIFCVLCGATLNVLQMVALYQYRQVQKEQEQQIFMLNHKITELTIRSIQSKHRDQKLDDMNNALQSIVDEITKD